MHTLLSRCLTVLALTATLGLLEAGAGCSDSPRTVTITGVVQGPAARSALRAPAVGGDRVWAIPILKHGGDIELGPINVAVRREVDVGPDGSFLFETPVAITGAELHPYDAGYPDSADSLYEADWVFMLVDSTASPPRIVSFIELPDGDEGLALVPVSTVSVGVDALDLGQVDEDTGTTSLTVSELQPDTDVSLEYLRGVARADNLVKTINDIARNCEITRTDGSCVLARVSHVFTANYAEALSTEAWWATSRGYGLSFTAPDRPVTEIASLCAGDVVYRLTPTNVVTVGGPTPPPPFSPTNPLTSGGAGTVLDSGNVCLGPEGTMFSAGSYVPDTWEFAWGGGEEVTGLFANTPAGDWHLERSTDGGSSYPPPSWSFDFALSSLLDERDATAMPRVFVPKVRIRTGTDAAGAYIAGMDVSWWWWDRTAGDWTAANPSLLGALVTHGAFEFGVSDMSSGITPRPHRGGQQPFEALSVIDFDDGTAANRFYLNVTDPGVWEAERIALSYQLFGGQLVNFVIRSGL